MFDWLELPQTALFPDMFWISSLFTDGMDSYDWLFRHMDMYRTSWLMQLLGCVGLLAAKICSRRYGGRSFIWGIREALAAELFLYFGCFCPLCSVRMHSSMDYVSARTKNSNSVYQITYYSFVKPNFSVRLYCFIVCCAVAARFLIMG